jgi:hypothetical protein
MRARRIAGKQLENNEGSIAAVATCSREKFDGGGERETALCACSRAREFVGQGKP